MKKKISKTEKIKSYMNYLAEQGEAPKSFLKSQPPTDEGWVKNFRLAMANILSKEGKFAMNSMVELVCKVRQEAIDEGELKMGKRIQKLVSDEKNRRIDIRAETIKEVLGLIPEKVDYPTNMASKRVYDKGNGYDKCRAEIIEKINKLK